MRGAGRAVCGPLVAVVALGRIQSIDMLGQRFAAAVVTKVIRIVAISVGALIDITAVITNVVIVFVLVAEGKGTGWLLHRLGFCPG